MSLNFGTLMNVYSVTALGMESYVTPGMEKSKWKMKPMAGDSESRNQSSSFAVNFSKQNQCMRLCVHLLSVSNCRVHLAQRFEGGILSHSECTYW